MVWPDPSVVVLEVNVKGFLGEHGDGHVRISLVENKQRIRQAARNAKVFLSSSSNTIETLEQHRAAAS